MAKKNDYKGDGLSFYKAVFDKGFDVKEIMSRLNIARGTLYNYYEREVLDSDTKSDISKALDMSEDEVFGIKSNPEQPEKTPKKVPMIGEGIAGTDMTIAYSDTANDIEYIDVGDLLKDSEAAFVVYGNSMTHNYPSGCVLGIKRNYDGFIQPGETYLLVTKSNRVFKRLYYNKEKTGYNCVSDNNMKHPPGHQEEGEFIYPSFPVKFDDVISIHDVIGMIRRNRNSGIIMRQK